MAEYIERERIVMDILGLTIVDPAVAQYADAVLRRLKEIPSADVVPVVHGRWDDSLDGITPFCTVCGCTHRCLIRRPLYCPNCGARMDGEKNEI